MGAVSLSKYIVASLLDILLHCVNACEDVLSPDVLDILYSCKVFNSRTLSSL